VDPDVVRGDLAGVVQAAPEPTHVLASRSGEEIARAREDWAAGRFGEVHGYPGDPLAAPTMPGVPLRPR
jgi:hypothetical protein